jgi:uncharacterized membrane protein
MSPSTAPSKPAAAPLRHLLLPVLLLIGYALLSNWLMVHAVNRPYTVALLFGPLLLAVAAVGWRQRQWATLAACAVLLMVLAAVVAKGGVQDMQLMYVLQHGGIHGALAWSFALTLRAGHKPLITLLAESVHGRLGQTFTPALAAYTRRLTVFWVGYFLAMVGASLLLYASAPWAWWSFFCTLLTPVFVVLLFAGEHVLRYHWHPDFPRVTMKAAFEAYQNHSKAGRA